MKKRTAFLAAVLLLLCLCGCGGQPSPAAGTSTDSTTAGFSVRPSETAVMPQSETESDAPAEPGAAQLYADYLAGGGLETFLSDYDDPASDYQAEACLADLNDDGIEELLLHLTNKAAGGVRGFPAVTVLLGLRNGKVERLGYAEYGGGSGGGDYIFIRYDTVEKKHVLEYEEFVRDGMFASTLAHHYFDVRQTDAEEKQYGLVGSGDVVYKAAHTLCSSSYAVEGVYASDAEKIMRETGLYTLEDGIVTAYRYDDAYISETDYTAMRARFVEPTDPAYQMKPVTPENPIPSA